MRSGDQADRRPSAAKTPQRGSWAFLGPARPIRSLGDHWGRWGIPLQWRQECRFMGEVNTADRAEPEVGGPLGVDLP